MKNFSTFLKATAILLALSHCIYAQNWDQIIKAVSSDRELRSTASRSHYDYFGGSVSVSGSYAVVGAQHEAEDNTGGNTVMYSGAAYVFKNENGKWIQIKKLTAPSRYQDDWFGLSVAIDGDRIVVGAAQHDRDAAEANPVGNAGSAYVFSKDQGGTDNWGLVQKLTAPVRNQDDNFGYAVSLSGDIIFVAAYREDEDSNETGTLTNSGSVYVFKLNTGESPHLWSFAQKLTASVRGQNDAFGRSISVKGDYSIIGALDNNGAVGAPGSNKGTAYIFKKNAQSGLWTQIKKITVSPAVADDYFGQSVAISGDYAIVGAPNDDQSASTPPAIDNAGAAYIFKRESGGADNWGEVKKITATTRAANAYFGRSVSIDGDYAVVGAYGENQGAGAGYVFRKQQGGADNWGSSFKLNPSVLTTFDHFGSSVSISGQYVFSGLPDDREDEYELNKIDGAGSAMIFKRENDSDNWSLVQKAVGKDRVHSDQFGYAVSVSGDYALVGSPYDDENADGEQTLVNAGSVYLFYNNQGNWSQIKKINPQTRANNAKFGISVALDGDYAIVGASSEKVGTIDYVGAAYIFNKNQGGAGMWGQVKRLVASSVAFGDNFGVSVSISADNAVVGADMESEDANDLNTRTGSGSAYIFSKDHGGTENWGQLRKITAQVRAANDNFAKSVSMSGDYLIVGAPNEDEDMSELNTLTSSGSAYIFKKDMGGSNNWGQIKKVTANKRSVNDLFGYSVAIGSQDAVVGAYQADADASETNIVSNAGAAYIFSKDLNGADNWAQSKKLTAISRGVNDYFGGSVSMHQDRVFVGAYGRDPDASGAAVVANGGAAYLYSRNTGGDNNWGLQEQIEASKRASEDNFGMAVAINGTNALVGVINQDWDAAEENMLPSAGAVYFFKQKPSPAISLNIPFAAGAYQSTYKMQDGLITHFCVDDKLLLSLQLGETNTGLMPDAVKLRIEPGANFYNKGTGFVAAENGAAILNRQWDVSVSQQPASPVKVRFYYSADDLDAINAQLTSNEKPALTSDTQLFFYKVTNNSLGEFPAIADIAASQVQLITHGSTASTSTWIKSTEQNHNYAEFFVASFSGGGVGAVPGGSLPVNLKSFNAEKLENSALLSWSTVAETNSELFEVQKSREAKNWHVVGEVMAGGSTASLRSYSFTDHYPFAPNSYYRLKMIDKDGTFAYSGIRSVGYQDQLSFKVYPNPVSGHLYMASPKQSVVEQVKIINMFGQAVYTSRKLSSDGISTSGFSPGLYSVQLSYSDGSSQTQKLVIIR